MDSETKKRYELLKEKQRRRIRELNWQTNQVLAECLDCLDGYELLSLDESDKLFHEFQNMIPFGEYGRISWKKIKNHVLCKDEDAAYRLCDGESEFYILWEMMDVPCVSCKLKTIFAHIYDVLAVGWNTWLLSKNKMEVIEFYHDREIVYGKI